MVGRCSLQSDRPLSASEVGENGSHTLLGRRRGRDEDDDDREKDDVDVLDEDVVEALENVCMVTGVW